MLSSTLVLEMGAAWTKCGLAEEELPRTVFRSIVATDAEGCVVGTGETELLLRTAPERVFSPFDETGDITSWEELGMLWNAAVSQRMYQTPSDSPLLLVESPFNTKTTRHKLAELCFETMGHPKLFMAKAPTLAAFGAERATALVLDCGATGTRAIPVYNGRVLPTTALWEPEGGNSFDRAIGDIFEEALGKLPIWCAENASEQHRKMARREKMTEIKEALVEMGASGQEQPRLEKGEIVLVADERTAALGERLVVTCMDLVANIITKTPRQLQEVLLSNMVLVGGGALITEFEEQLRKEILTVYPGAQLQAGTELERRFGAWTGGAALATMADFQHLWITRDEYNEEGGACTDKRDF